MEHESGLIFAGVEIPAVIVSTWLIILGLFLLSRWLTRDLQVRPRKRSQLVAEFLVSALLDLFTQIFGGNRKKARTYLPLLLSFFVLIISSNYSGLIPGVGLLPGLEAPTSSLSVTLGLAFCAISSMFFFGIRHKGLHFFKEWLEPYPFLLPLNILDEIVKPVSLALRLYGSVYAEEVILRSVFALIPIGAPVPFYFISLFFGALQALVFTLLTATYISQAVQE